MTSAQEAAKTICDTLRQVGYVVTWDEEATKIIQRCIDQSLAPYKDWILNCEHKPTCPANEYASDGIRKGCDCGLNKLRQSLQEQPK